MPSLHAAALPPDLARVRSLLDAWRLTASPHARLPEALWQPIMELLDSHSIAAVSRALALDKERLRRRRKTLAQREAPGPEPAPQFLELVARDAAPAHSCRTGGPAELALGLERRDGLRLTITLPAHEWPRLESLVRALLAQP